MKAIIVTVVFGLLSVAGFAERVGREAEIENPSVDQLKSLKGKIVVFEGLAWGDGWPGLGRRVILATGARLYLEKGKLTDFPNGSLVRVHGRLLFQHMRAVRGIESGYDRSFDYWAVEEPTIEVIDKASTEHVEAYGEPQVKKANQSSEPTPTSGTSAAEQPLVPAAVVAHL